MPLSEPAGRTDHGAARRLLLTATDGRGRDPSAWALAPLAGAGRVVTLLGGRGPLAGELRRDGAGASFGTLAQALPLRTNSVDGVAVLLALPHLDDVDGVFGELRRVLRPAGTLVLLVPSVTVRTLAELRFARALAPVRRSGWANRSALEHSAWLLAAADFAVLGDDRGSFGLPVPDAAAAHDLARDLPASGFWPPDVTAGAGAALAARAGTAVRLPVPLRRIVARR